LTHPHTFAWFILVNRFHETVRASWGGAPSKKVEKVEKKVEDKVEAKVEATKEEKPADDDDMDLFGDDSEEDSDVRLIFNRTELISLYRPSKPQSLQPKPRLLTDPRRSSLLNP
jgi:hypothetical protein